MCLKNTVKLSNSQLSEIDNILNRGKHNAQLRNRAAVLKLANRNEHTDSVISEMTGKTVNTIAKIRKRFTERGFQETLYGLPKSGRRPKITGKDEAVMTAMACQETPDGVARPTVRAIAADFRTQDGQQVGRETVRRTLNRLDAKPWQKRNSSCLRRSAPPVSPR